MTGGLPFWCFLGVYGLVSLGDKNCLPVASRNGPGPMTSNALNEVNALEGY